MAIKGFKTIEDMKGYKLDSKDREIFERELKESLFGNSGTSWNIYGNTDMIEFVLFDSNDNQLPQGDSGHLVRYINLDDDNIQKYFRISDDIDDIKSNGAREFLVDTEVLIREAGYDNGIFKTQITLLNRRAGSEVLPHDKMWIHEISPSRTEIRLLPVQYEKNKVLPDLQERYNVYINNGDFRDDTISFVQEYVENISTTDVFNTMLRLKGHTKDGQGYINLIKKEFKIQDFGRFILDVKTLLVKAMQNWVENKDSNVNSNLFGKPLNSTPPVQLSVDEIERKVVYTLTDVIDKLLSKRDILEKSQLSQEDQITMDEIDHILQSTTSETIYESTLPPSISAQVRGCMDPNAENFNPEATVEDNSCIYPLPPVEVIPEVEEEGVENDDTTPADTTEPDAPVRPTYEIKTTRYYVWSDTGTIIYSLPTERDGSIGRTIEWTGNEYDMVDITYVQKIRFIGDIRTYAKPFVTRIKCSDPRALNFGEVGVCVYDSIEVIDTRQNYFTNNSLAGDVGEVVTPYRFTGTVEDSNIIRFPATTVRETTEYYIPRGDEKAPETYLSSVAGSGTGRIRIIRDTV